MSNFKRQLFKILFFIITIIIFVVIIFNLKDYKKIFLEIKNSNKTLILISLLVLCVYLGLNELSLYIVTKIESKETKALDVSLISKSSNFFNGITPFQAGGQPFMVYAYNKVKVKPSKSTGIVLMDYVSYQLAIVIICLLSLICSNRLIVSTNIKILLGIGILINVLVLAVIFLIGLSDRTRRIITNIVNLFLRLKIFRKSYLEKKERFNKFSTDFQSTFKNIIRHKRVFMLTLFIKMLSIISFYAITFFVLKSINKSIGYSRLIDVICLSSYSSIMTCFIPTPGASGGVEVAFNYFFKSIFDLDRKGAISSVILLRGITYYLVMILGFFSYIIFMIIHRKTKVVVTFNQEELEEKEEEIKEIDVI